MDRKTREIVMAKLYLKNNDYKAAEKNFNDHLAQYPEDVQALKLLAQVYEKTNRNHEAFQMFERCYLIEPDRPGILLEICRVLQKELLEQVDYHKWCSLAVKNFPTSPIVMDLKSFMSTLPPQRETILANDPLSKILEKLTLMDRKFDNLDTRIGGLETNLKTIEKKLGQIEKVDVSSVDTSSVQAPTPTLDAQAQTAPISLVKNPTFSSSPAKSQTVPSPAPKPSSPVMQTTTTTAPNVPGSTPPSQTSIFSTPATTQNSFFQSSSTTGSIFQVSANQPSIFQTSKSQQTPSLFSSIQTSNVQALPAANKLPTNQNTIGQIPNSTVGQTFTFGKSSSTLFGDLGGGASSQGANLFSESLNRLNLPAVGDWTTQTSGNSNMPFSSSVTTGGSSQPITSNSPNKGAKEDDDNEVVQTEELPIENFCEMQPIEIKTGEEDEDILFKHRCKLFRLRDKEYKERGLGDIKVLKHKNTGKGRLIMRRDAVGLVCLNCWHCSKIERVRDNQVRIMGLDASDGEPEASCLLVKFKTPEITDTFLKHLNEIFPEDGLNESTASRSSPAKPSNSKIQQDSLSDKSEIELVDPKLDPSLVDKARQYQLPDLFYHKLKHEEGKCVASDGCDDA